MQLVEHGIPRRNRIALMTPAEKAIRDAVHAVEAAGADERLTDAVNLLIAAGDSVADWIEGVKSRRAVCDEAIWRPMGTAPKDGTHIDLWAKTWLSASDRFESQRFPRCCWMPGDSMCNRSPYWLSLDTGWYPTHWMPIPEGPIT